MIKPFLPRNLSKPFLFLLDGLGIYFCVYLAHILRLSEIWGPFHRYLIAIFFITSLVLYLVEAYSDKELFLNLDIYARTILGVIVSGILIAAMVYIGGIWGTDSLFSRFIFPFSMFMFMFWAIAVRRLIFNWVVAREEKMRWVIFGENELINQFREDFKASGEYGELICLGCEPKLSPNFDATITKNLEKINDWLDKDLSGIITGFGSSTSNKLNLLLVKARMKGIRIFSLEDYYEIFWHKVPVMDLKDRWFIFSSGFELLHNQHWLKIKRYMDIVFSLILATLTAPIMALTAIVIKVIGKGPIIYSQRRTGLNGKEFTLYKFRTMVLDAENEGPQWTAKEDPRVISIGWFLRLTHIDELPQVLNILRGEMSFIGPRPERPEFIGQFKEKIPYYDFRHLVKPGITGWGQVMGHQYGSSVEDVVQKLQYDLYYLKNFSLLLDISIIFKTLRLVLFAKGR